jgi:hypothetical protein
VRRSSLTSPTVASRAKEAANLASRKNTPQKSVVVKVITASSLKTAQSKKESSTATETKKDPPASSEPVPARKVQIKRPLDDDEDDIYAYYAKKKQRMEELRQGSKAPNLSSSKPSPSVTKPKATSSVTLKPVSSSVKSMFPDAKRKATVQSIQAKSIAKPSTAISKLK